jgi:hypothetical protein
VNGDDVPGTVTFNDDVDGTIQLGLESGTLVVNDGGSCVWGIKEVSEPPSTTFECTRSVNEGTETVRLTLGGGEAVLVGPASGSTMTLTDSFQNDFVFRKQ